MTKLISLWKSFASTDFGKAWIAMQPYIFASLFFDPTNVL
jgi:hypothetical protein